MLDLRLPIGVFFLLIGIILGVDGIFEPVKEPGVGIVLNRDWGLCLVIFGALMTLFGWRGQRAQDAADTRAAEGAKNPSANG